MFPLKVTQIKHNHTNINMQLTLFQLHYNKRTVHFPWHTPFFIRSRLCLGSTSGRTSAQIKLPIGKHCLRSVTECQPKQIRWLERDSDEQECVEEIKAGARGWSARKSCST